MSCLPPAVYSGIGVDLCPTCILDAELCKQSSLQFVHEGPEFVKNSNSSSLLTSQSTLHAGSHSFTFADMEGKEKLHQHLLCYAFSFLDILLFDPEVNHLFRTENEMKIHSQVNMTDALQQFNTHTAL